MAARKTEELSARWRELAGSNDWAGMLDPIDPMLRSELIRYGELVQVCYDAFDFDKFSKYCGGCKYPQDKLFESVGLADVGYQVTRYLYATSNINLPHFSVFPKKNDMNTSPINWIGYVAVSDDTKTVHIGRRDIVIAWRGTVTKLEWISDITDIQRSLSDEGIPCPDTSVKALAGFLDLYTDKNPSSTDSKYSVREQVLAEVYRLVKLYGQQRGDQLSISVMGHSLGSALATVNALDIAEVGLHTMQEDKITPVTVYSYAGPRVGNDQFKKRFEEVLKIKCIRVSNLADVVPDVPGVLVNEESPGMWKMIGGAIVPWSYHHVGVKFELDHKKSPFLKTTFDLGGFHNLEGLLHIVDGYHGKMMEFSLATGRDPVLINKSSNFLTEELMVPPSWMQDANRGLVRTVDGKWVQPFRARVEDHPNDMDHVLQQISLLNNNNY